MTKTFAQIETTLPHSRKLRQLSHAERWAYLCAHLTPLGGFIGLFRYPKAVWADDADLSVAELDVAIQKMTGAGLLSFDHDEDFVRIHSWFLKKNAPENASRMASIAADYADLDAPDELILTSAAEFTVGALKRAQRWKPDSVEWGKLREVFKPFLATMRHNFEDDFHAALADQIVGQNRAVRVELCALMPSLQHHLEAPCPHPAHTVGAHDTKTRRHLDETETRKDENYTDQNSSENVQPFTSLSFAEVGSAEKEPKAQGPRSQTIEAARRIGAIP
ncbi:hypothetical protein JQX09_24440 [Sulfitobacter pseudonitzschiae]|uniref:Uncharacterized protein n=1 Tax=Pseudosulfitobacter pseudonitzschiae TaxID=1402135 RepID=A0A9Q2NTW9_9RHOB|nr:hypothetical protein [Pseudosulfitobacter pseudonitzschiae]MBM2295115.1 hypothetical protein [Pseudosulfitobacter pseudonitzschiae]MBM2300027.1 hypothetical protein [Pseudosulfitobacter pseudonitzschiae]MBM2304948.1 hypothetical protein [Pseudosulfitobacter pseudonitzschiae]MBM2314726.1 hypothetical protein [Pseudosulfitobacter pseudonitzschiae]MBM2319591.1 hypothetical protein [Pseudosulfitobacter pseudonitzschiae]